MKTFLKMFLAVILAQVILLGIFVLILTSKMEEKVEVPDGAVLVQSIHGAIPESAPASTMPFPGSAELTQVTLLENLEKARFDDRIQAVVLKIGSPGLGFAMLDELREKITQLREAGKPVWGHMHILGTKGLYLGSACDSLFLLAGGYVSLRGMAAGSPFAKGALEKLGIRENLHKIENYKQAAELIQREDLSPAARENLAWILDAYYPHLVAAIEEGRGLEPGQLERDVFSQGALLPREARDLGLVDGLGYWDEVEARLLALPGVEAIEKDNEEYGQRPRTICGCDYAKVSREDAGIDGEQTIAVVHAVGTLEGEESGYSFPWGTTLGAQTMERAFRAAAEDEDVAAIIFRIDSGGGESSTSWRVQRSAVRAAQAKPVITSMADMAASGAYMICYPLKPLIANHRSVVGSIGSISGKFNMRGLYNKLGITWDYISRGPNALIDSDYFDYTPEQWASFTQRHWMDYQDWVADIALHRGKTPAEIDSLGRGRVFTGDQALERGLIDEVGTFDLAIARAKEAAGIPAEEEVKIVHYPRKRGFLETLKSGGFAAAVRVLVQEVFSPTPREGTWAIDMNDYRMN